MPAVFTLVGVPVTLAELGSALLLFLLRVTLVQWLRVLLVGLASLIPFVGGYFADGLDAVFTYVDDALAAAISGLVSLAAAWWEGAGIALEMASEAISGLASDAYDAFETLFTATIPNAVSDVMGWASAEFSGLINGVVADVELIWSGIDALGNSVVNGFEQVWRGIDDLGTTFGAWTSYLAAQGIDNLAWLWEDGLPWIYGELDTLWDFGKDLAGQIGDLTQRVNEVLPYIIGLAAAIPLVDAIAGIKAAARAERKLDKLCTLDLDEVDDLLELAIIIPSLALIVSAVDAAAGGIDEILGAASEAFE